MRKLLLPVLCAVFVSACAKDDKMTVTGRLEGLPDGTVMKLVPGATHKNQEPVAESTVTDGAFAFEQTLEEPRLFYIWAEDIRGNISILAAPGDKIVIGGTFAEPVVIGSKLHGEYVKKFIDPRAEMNKLHAETQSKYADISRRLGEARQNGDAAAETAIRESEEWKEAEKANSDFFRKMNEMLDKAIADNSGTFWAPLLLLSHTAYLTPENEEHYNMFSDEAKNSYYGKIVAEEIFGLVGRAPAFTAKDAEGNEHTLEQLLAGGNYVLIDFWASWCGPCRRFVPTLKELAVKYADKGLIVVSISTDKDREAWLGALAEEGMPWLNLLDESGISDGYGVSGIPSLFLIDPQGELIFSKQSGPSLIDKLAEVFGN